MIPTRLMPQVVTVTTVVQDGPPDEFGDPTETTTTATYRGWIEQRDRDEDTAAIDQQAETWRLFLEPAAAGLSGHDRVAVDGVDYEVTGPPWAPVNPRTGAVPHVVATVRRVS